MTPLNAIKFYTLSGGPEAARHCMEFEENIFKQDWQWQYMNSKLQISVRPSEQLALKGPGNLLNTNCIKRDPGFQDKWQTTYRKVSLPFKWFQDSVRSRPTANKIQMFWVDLQGTLLFPGIYSPFYPGYPTMSPEISFVCSPQLWIESLFSVCVL